ncbi:MAG TPA: glycosyltransferase [Candidatus Dormibacteraeota bacterium]|nr:glycosyltransferase [Candidatus Dormibacteraeota bacterium]
MRALFTTLPATGHFNSIMQMALAVAAAGHDVAVCCSPAFADELRRSGLEHLPGGADDLESISGGAPPLGDPRRRQFMQLEVFAGRAALAMIPDLVRHAEAWRPDVLVNENGEMAASLVAEKLDRPHASIGAGSLSSLPERREQLGPTLSIRRAELGLPPDPEAEMLFRYLHFAFVPPRWDGEVAHPETIHFIRYENPDRPGEVRPGWLDAPRDRPLVLASLGTLMNGLPGLFEAIIEAVAGEPIEVVAAIGRGQDPARFGTPPTNVRIEAFVPQILVLAESTLFVAHGGFNGTKEALRLGLPLVVIPIGGDQPYTAERVEALGLGRAVAPSERDPATIRSRIREVLADERFRRNAQAFAADMQALPPMEHAVALLEELARERQPIPRSPDW